MSEIVTVLKELLVIPGFMSSVGWMIAIAVFMGGFAWWNMRELKYWFLITAVFVICTEYLRYMYFIGRGEPYSIRPAVFIAFTFLIYLLGMGIGILISWCVSKKTFRHYSHLESKTIRDVYAEMKAGNNADIPDDLLDTLKEQAKKTTRERRDISRQVTDASIGLLCMPPIVRETDVEQVKILQ